MCFIHGLVLLIMFGSVMGHVIIRISLLASKLPIADELFKWYWIFGSCVQLSCDKNWQCSASNTWWNFTFSGIKCSFQKHLDIKWAWAIRTRRFINQESYNPHKSCLNLTRWHTAHLWAPCCRLQFWHFYNLKVWPSLKRTPVRSWTQIVFHQ